MDIYILLCDESKYYIGKTRNIIDRVGDHFDGKGSEWTKKYKPINTVEIHNNCDKYDEDKYVLKYMEKYGIDNVRGGSYTQSILSDEQINNIKRQITAANDLCHKCGKPGHFIRQCPDNQQETKEDDFVHVETDAIIPQVNDAPPTICSTIGKIIKNIILSHMADNYNDTSNKNNNKTSNKGICSRCGRSSHIASKCYATTDINGNILACSRCGRTSHIASKCYAKSNKDGDPI